MKNESILRYYTLFSTFATKRVSASPTNTHYTIGGTGDVLEGAPDILWRQLVFFGDRDAWWTNGVLHEAGAKVLVDTILSINSNNPISNSAVASAFAKLATINDHSLLEGGDIHIAPGISSEKVGDSEPDTDLPEALRITQIIKATFPRTEQSIDIILRTNVGSVTLGTIPAATAVNAGLMSAEMVKKLNSQQQVDIVTDISLSDTSSNPVANHVLTAEFGRKQSQIDSLNSQIGTTATASIAAAQSAQAALQSSQSASQSAQEASNALAAIRSQIASILSENPTVASLELKVAEQNARLNKVFNKPLGGLSIPRAHWSYLDANIETGKRYLIRWNMPASAHVNIYTANKDGVGDPGGENDYYNQSVNQQTIAASGEMEFVATMPAAKLKCYCSTVSVELSLYLMDDNRVNNTDALLERTLTDINNARLLMPYKGKRILSLGDSYTWMNYYGEWLAQATGCTQRGRGQNGGTIDTFCNDTYDLFVAGGGQASEPFNASLLSQYDIVTIMGGTNDYGSNRSCGDISDAPMQGTTVIAGLKYIIEKILTLAPDIKIFVCTQPYRCPNSNFHNGLGGYLPNGAGATMSDVAYAIVKTANYYGIPCLDFYHEGGWNKFNNRETNVYDASNPVYSRFLDNKYTLDGLHPREGYGNGAWMLGTAFGKFINQHGLCDSEIRQTTPPSSGDVPETPEEPETNQSFTIGSWNVGHFSLGKSSSPSFTDDKAATVKADMVAAMQDANLDMIAVNEYHANYNSGKTLDTRVDIFGSFSVFHEMKTVNAWYKGAFFANRINVSSCVERAGFISRRHFLDIDGTIGGKSVKILVMHGETWDYAVGYDSTKWPTQVEYANDMKRGELEHVLGDSFTINGETYTGLGYYNKCERLIIIGDLNVAIGYMIPSGTVVRDGVTINRWGLRTAYPDIRAFPSSYATDTTDGSANLNSTKTGTADYILTKGYAYSNCGSYPNDTISDHYLIFATLTPK